LALPGITARLLLAPVDEDELVIVGRMPEAGGWSPDVAFVEVGQEVTLRITSDDVVHGLKLAGEALPAVEVEPGQWREIRWRPEKAGEVTFYCTRWCGPNHWRMTGTIMVAGPDGIVPTPTPAPAPRFVQLGVDIDHREALPELAGLRPSSERGETLLPPEYSLPPGLPDAQLMTPYDLWSALRREAEWRGIDDAALWDVAAALWLREMSGEVSPGVQELYRQNCAACHGERGQGDGVMADAFRDPPPADFTDLSRMATANRVILEGKMLRGGMGTGMPFWGKILTLGEVEAMVDHLWRLTFGGSP
jgi:hypothetical protein